MLSPTMPPGRKPKNPRTGWAKKILTLRNKAGLSQREAAEKVGVPFRTWRSWENEQRTPHAIIRQHVIDKFADES